MSTDTSNTGDVGGVGEGQTGEGQSQGQGFSPEFVEALRNKLGSQDQEIRGLRESTGTLEKLRQVFSPTEDKPKGKWIDPILHAAIEAEKRGQAMPITTEVAVEVQRLRELVETLEARDREKEDRLRRISDPAAWQDQQMFATMDDQLQQLVGNLYPGQDSGAQHRAMIERTSAHLKELQEDPEIWKEFRNNKNAQQRLIQHVAKQFVPSRALAQMQDEYERKTPYTRQQLQEAWEAAQQIQDPRKKEQVTAELRRTIIGLNMAKTMKPRR